MKEQDDQNNQKKNQDISLHSISELDDDEIAAKARHLAYYLWARNSLAHRNAIAHRSKTSAFRRVLLTPLTKPELLYAIFVPSKANSSRPKGLLVDLLMPPEMAEEALYNILGRYDYWVSKHGRFWARVIFMSQSAGCVLNHWSSWLLKRVRLLELFRRS